MLIAQISDLHVTTDGPEVNPLVDQNAAAARAIGALNALTPRPDVVLATGDLTDHGTAEEYEILRIILAELVTPVHLIPGNHDDARVMIDAYGGSPWLPTAVLPVLYAIDDHPVRLVGIDTSVPGRHDGVFGPDRAAALAAVLAEDERPTLVFMHHPPFATGIWWMDAVGMADPEPFRAVVEAHPQVVRVVSGHVHRSISTAWGGIQVSVCPSTAHQVGLDLNPDCAPRATAEPPSFQLHQWTGSGFVTHTAPVVLDVDVLDITAMVPVWDNDRDADS